MKLTNIKKILLFTLITFLLSSCWWTKNEEKEEKEEKNEIVKNEEVDKVEEVEKGVVYNTKELKEKNIREVVNFIIKDEKKYDPDFVWISQLYSGNYNEIWILESYLSELEYQGVLEDNKKEYAKVITIIGEKFVKQINDNKIILDEIGKEMDLPLILNKLWNNFKILEDTDKAIFYYKEAVKIKKDYYQTYIELGNIYTDLKKTKEAKESFEQAKNIIKDNKIIEKINEELKDIVVAGTYYGWYIELGIIYKLYWEELKSKNNLKKAEKIIKEASEAHLNKYSKKNILNEINKILK